MSQQQISDLCMANLSSFPLELADRSFDNVGLLQDNIDPASIGEKSRAVSKIVLLTNDLTTRVAEEAIRKKASIIVTYRGYLSQAAPVKWHSEYI